MKKTEDTYQSSSLRKMEQPLIHPTKPGWINNHFGRRVLSRRCEHEWAPYSPDLSPPDFSEIS